MRLHVIVGASIIAWTLLESKLVLDYTVIASLTIIALAIALPFIINNIYRLRVYKQVYAVYALAYALMPLTYLRIEGTALPTSALPMVYLIATFLLLVDGALRNRSISTAAIEVADLTERTVDVRERRS